MSEIVLLDGGMGQELIARSKRAPSPLWSAEVMLQEPELVADVHRDFIRAGAGVLTVNTYSVTPQRLDRHGRGDLFETLQARAIELAKRARDDCGRTVAIAGCLPPLVASYRPELSPEPSSALETYRRIVEAQAKDVDLFIGETLPTIAEARAAATAARESGLPVWIALTIDDDEKAQLRSGEPLSEAVVALGELGVEARLINCCRPEAVSAAWPEFSAGPGVTGAYANGFTSVEALKPGGTVEALDARQDLTPSAYADFALEWVRQGASIVGGCCEVGPGHILTLARLLAAEGHRVVPPSLGNRAS
jgi:S-methylmethionine-dependent homocysteine/selenocysteine methylase